MKRIVTLFLSLVLLLSCLCAPASAVFDPSLFYEVQARSAYSVNTDTNIIVYDKDSSRQVPAGGLTKYMTIALLLTNYADQLDNTFQMPFAISDYVHNSDMPICAPMRPSPTGKPSTPCFCATPTRPRWALPTAFRAATLQAG